MTKNGTMRQASFVGLRTDKPARQVVLETPRAIGPAPVKKDGGVQLTHLAKVFWPKLGITKGDILEYYRAVSPLLLKYLKDRPESMLRQPDGITGEGFFQKDVARIAPKWATTFTSHSGSAERDVMYLVANNLKSLEFMLQLGVIEINPWNSRVKKPDNPDWVVIDLDPEGVRFSTVIEVAQSVKAVCDELEIRSYPKTSGKTGIHIYIPLGAQYSYEQARQFAELIANLVHQKVPKISSVIRNPKKRQHRVYLDFLQNHQGQTLAAPYCVRPSAFAGVSTPLEWSEVRQGLKPENFTIKNALARFKQKGDLFAPVLQRGINMKKAMDKATP
jgi:bifunctional non-homologous end joining protein LigD